MKPHYTQVSQIKSLSKLIEIHDIDETTLDSSFPNKKLVQTDRNS